MNLVKAKAVVPKLRRRVKQFKSWAVERSKNLGGGGGGSITHQGLLKGNI
jgi:hypothetical protein